jgi:TM2 domain-containing membrane protein YozV
VNDPTAEPYRQPADPYAAMGETLPADPQQTSPPQYGQPANPPVSTPPVSSPTAPLPPGADPAGHSPPAITGYPPQDYAPPGYPQGAYAAPVPAYGQPGYGQPGYGPGYPPPGYGHPGIDPATGLPLSDKSRVVAGVLQLVLGGFGAGRFYTGHTSMAIAQIAVTWLTCGLGGIWPLVDGIMILVQQEQTDAQGRVLRP